MSKEKDDFITALIDFNKIIGKTLIDIKDTFKSIILDLNNEIDYKNLTIIDKESGSISKDIIKIKNQHYSYIVSFPKKDSLNVLYFKIIDFSDEKCMVNFEILNNKK